MPELRRRKIGIMGGRLKLDATKPRPSSTSRTSLLKRRRKLTSGRVLRT